MAERIAHCRNTAPMMHIRSHLHFHIPAPHCQGQHLSWRAQDGCLVDACGNQGRVALMEGLWCHTYEHNLNLNSSVKATVLWLTRTPKHSPFKPWNLDQLGCCYWSDSMWQLWWCCVQFALSLGRSSTEDLGTRDKCGVCYSLSHPNDWMTFGETYIS